MLRCSYKRSILFSVLKCMSLQLAMNGAKLGGTNKSTPDLDKKNYFTWLIDRWRLSSIGGCFDIRQKFERLTSFYVRDGSLKRRYLSFNLHNVMFQLTIIFELTKCGSEISYAKYIHFWAYLDMIEDPHQMEYMCSSVDCICFLLWNGLVRTSPVLGVRRVMVQS